MMDTNCPSPSHPVPTIGWLTNILLTNGALPEGVAVVGVGESDVGRMGKGNIVPYTISYCLKETQEPVDVSKLINTFIVKYAVSGGASDDNFDKGGLMKIDTKEFRFITIAREAWVLKELPEGTFSTPKIYYSIANFNDPEGMFIAMEDLRPFTTRMDQFHGAQNGSNINKNPLKRNTSLSSKEAWKRAFEEVAGTHAKYWNLKSISSDSKTRLKGAGWMNGNGRGEWEASLGACRLAWEKVNKSKISQRVNTFITQCLENATFDRAVKQMNSRPKTLLHGDFHAKNLFWDEDEKRVIMTDFSEVGIGNPMSDLVQYIISDVQTDVRRKGEDRILKAYWNRLISSGVDPNEYSYSQCWESYKQEGLDRWVWFFPMLAYFGYNADFFHDQIDGFLQDHKPNVDDFVLLYGVELVEHSRSK